MATSKTKGIGRRRVGFVLRSAPGATVSVAGDFNGWDPAAKPMVDAAGDGQYAATCMLTPGIHEYKFVVNGEWTVDPSNPRFTVNPLGTLNSVIEVT